MTDVAALTEVVLAELLWVTYFLDFRILNSINALLRPESAAEGLTDDDIFVPGFHFSNLNVISIFPGRNGKWFAGGVSVNR